MITKRKHILVVDDEPAILDLLRINLEDQGYRITTVKSGEEALKKIRSFLPDLIILDLMLPGIDGLEICRLLKAKPETKEILILMLTAKGSENDIVIGLELGADDYFTKPFSPRVLVARIKALLRRKAGASMDKQAVLKYKKMEIHPGRREVTINNELVELTFSEFQILHLLASKPGWVYTRNQIIDSVRGDNYPVTDRTVDFQIVGLRKKLGKYGNFINTVRGVGYRLRDVS